jgi:hypothetical protein
MQALVTAGRYLLQAPGFWSIMRVLVADFGVILWPTFWCITSQWSTDESV